MQNLLTHADLNARRKSLGMTYSALARRSGVSLPTVQRVMAGGVERATLTTVLRIVEALGLDFALVASEDAESYREKQAEEKARKIVQMVQGTSGLEGQAVDKECLRRMVDRTKQELLQASRKLWAA